ncbi:MAG: hypothetical protein CV089_21310 [Nitrospira sp. WS110]|nr:hypothetical protein [Nitrospira sp. WS110]
MRCGNRGLLREMHTAMVHVGFPAAAITDSEKGLSRNQLSSNLRATKGRDMTIKNGDAPDSTSCANQVTTQDWVARLRQLTDRLALCPTDIATRCELAALFEQLGQHEEALVNWSAALSSEPNNLMAREGSARCRQWMGRSLRSSS